MGRLKDTVTDEPPDDGMDDCVYQHQLAADPDYIAWLASINTTKDEDHEVRSENQR